MADYTVRLSAQDNLSGTIKTVKEELNDLGSTATTSLDKFKQRFERIESSAAPLKRQLKDLKALMGEMQFKGMANTEEFTRIAQYAGRVKDAMDDAANATKRFADDTFALKAAADAMTVVTGAFTAATGAMNLFGVKNEEVKNAILKVQSAMAILNGVQAIANALNKESALMQALKATKMKISTAVAKANTAATNSNTIAERTNMETTKQDTIAKTANTIAETANGVATKKSTVIQNAWNVAKAVAKALLGDITGLLLVSAGALVTYALATANSTDEIEDQSKALNDNNDAADRNVAWKERLKKSEKEWSDAVSQAASSQIAKYTELQLKWQECNKSQKEREKFQRQYGEEVNRVAGKVKKLSEYEDFFVRDTDKVVEAILARAAAEAGAKKYAEAILRKAENDRNGTVANGRYFYNAKAGTRFTDLSPEEQAYLKSVGGANASQNPYLSYHAGWSSYWEINAEGAKQVEKFRQKVANDIKAQDDAEIANWQNFTKERQKAVREAEKAAGMGSGYNPPSAYGGGSGSSSKGGSGTEKKGEEQVKPVSQSLEWLREQLRKLQQDLAYGLIPADKIEETKAKIEYLKKDIEKKEIELGFRVVPIEGSLEDLEQQLSKIKDDLEKGKIPAEKVAESIEKMEDLTTRINNKKIEIGFEEAPTTDYQKRISGYQKWIKDVEKANQNYEHAKSEIDRQLQEDDAKLAQQLRDGLITQEEYTRKSEQLWDDYTKKMENLPEVVVYDKPNTSLDNIAKHYEDMIHDIETQLNENDLEVEARIELTNTKQDLERQRDEILHGKLTIPATIEPQYIEEGSAWDLRQSYENQAAKIRQVADDYDKGIIKSAGEAKRQIAVLNYELKKLGLNPIEIEIKTKGQQALENVNTYLSGFAGSITSTVDAFEQLVKSIDEGANGWEIFKNIISTTETVLTSITTVMQLVNTLTAAHTAISTANAAATTADAAASMGNAAAKSSEATATAGVAVAETAAQNAKMGPFGWVMAIAGAVALAATLFALIGKFAGGGIVGGHSYSGDKLIARVNSGEMILNRRQQKNLFNAINNGDLGGSNAKTVSFRLKGSDLYGALKNYQKIKGKSGVVTGIE